MSEVDLLQLHMARHGKEKSSALPREFYSDPAQHVKFSKEGCDDCKYERIIAAGAQIGVGVCMKKRTEESKHQYGTRCANYRKKGCK